METAYSKQFAMVNIYTMVLCFWGEWLRRMLYRASHTISRSGSVQNESRRRYNSYLESRKFLGHHFEYCETLKCTVTAPSGSPHAPLVDASLSFLFPGMRPPYPVFILGYGNEGGMSNIEYPYTHRYEVLKI